MQLSIDMGEQTKNVVLIIRCDTVAFEYLNHYAGWGHLNV